MKKKFLTGIIAVIFLSLLGPLSNAKADLKLSEIKINKSTNEVLDFEILLPRLEFSEKQTDFGVFHKINNISGRDPICLVGGGSDNFSKPETPVYTAYIALPMEDGNAKVSVSAEKADVQSGIRLFPIQKPTRDKIGAKDDESFQFNEDIYKASIVKHGVMSLEPIDPQSMTNGNIYELKLNLVDYTPEKECLVTYSSIHVTITFSGNLKYFSKITKNTNENMASLDDVDQYFESQPSFIESVLLNKNVYELEAVKVGTAFYLNGARFIIVTPPDFLAAAQDLKAHKIARGISTKIIQTSAADTVETIKSKLLTARITWWVKPKWVLFLGDAEFIPTHYGSANTWDNADNSGDIYYGQFSGDDTGLPLFGIGRLPVDTQEQAQVIVDKIKAYENSPPSSPYFYFDDPYYGHLTFAAEFQDVNDDNPIPDGQAVRWFAETSEDIAVYLESLSMNINRIYKKSSAHDPEFWQDGTPIPSNLEPPGFAWDGDKYDIIAAVNSGTSILYHRDHGDWDGWGNPSFRTTDLSSINVTDNEFPVVYSINCRSGIFDNETDNVGYYSSSSAVYFAENFIRKSDGAIAVIGDTRSSHTLLNNDLAKGLFDATFPGYLPYGDSTTTIRKLGDVLNHAKGYVKTRGYENSDLRQELLIYNLLGDPTVELLSRPPRRIIFKKFELLKELIRVPIYVEKFVEEPCLGGCPPVFGVLFAKLDKEEVVVGRGIINVLKEKNLMTINVNTELIKEMGASELRIVVSGAPVITAEQTLQL